MAEKETPNKEGEKGKEKKRFVLKVQDVIQTSKMEVQNGSKNTR